MKILVMYLFLVISVGARSSKTINGREAAILTHNSHRPSSIPNTQIDGDLKNYGIKKSANTNALVTSETRKLRGAKHNSAVLTNRIKFILDRNVVDVDQHPLINRVLNGTCRLRKELESRQILKKAIKYIFAAAYGFAYDQWGGNMLNNPTQEVIADIRAYFEKRCKEPEPTEMKDLEPIEMKDTSPEPIEWKDMDGGYNSNPKFKMADEMSLTPYPHDYYSPNRFMHGELAQEGQGHQLEHEYDWRVSDQLASRGQGQGHVKDLYTRDSAEYQNMDYINTDPWAHVQGQHREQDWNIFNELTSGGHKRMTRGASN